MKLRLDYFLSLGLTLEHGDFIDDGDGNPFEITQLNQLILDKYVKFYTVVSFVPRKNTGEQPCDDDMPVLVEYSVSECLDGEAHAAFMFEWDLNDGCIKSWKYDLEALIKMQAEHDTKEAEPVKSVYTQAMKDAGDDIEIGMLYIDEDGRQCSLIGENNGECVYVGRPTSNKIHPRYISVSAKDDCKPIDTRTPEEKQVEEICTLLIDNGYTLDPDAIILMQAKGLLAETK